MPRNGSAGYEHPGKLFIARNGPPESGDAVLEYARFLREESGLTDVPPIDLQSIYERFGIPEPRRVHLPGEPDRRGPGNNIVSPCRGVVRQAGEEVVQEDGW